MIEIIFYIFEKKRKNYGDRTKFCTEKNINNAKISGIGAVKNTEIGAYDTVTKKYVKKQFNNVLELVSEETLH